MLLEIRALAVIWLRLKEDWPAASFLVSLLDAEEGNAILSRHKYDFGDEIRLIVIARVLYFVLVDILVVARE